MEISQLVYFSKAAKLESISKAAAELHVTQPAVSRAISKLEDELGCPLFDRRGRRLLLNNRGRAYLESVDGALNDLKRAALIASAGQGGVTGSVSIAVFGAQDEPLDFAMGFMRDNPGINVAFECRERTCTKEITRRHDLVFFVDDEGFRGISGIPYGRRERLACVSESHPLAGEDEISLEQLKDEPFVLTNTTAGSYEQDFAFCVKCGFSPRVRLTTSSGAAQMQFIRAGLGVGFAESTAAGNRRPGVKTLRITESFREVAQCFACRPVHLLSEEGALLLRRACEHFGAPLELAEERFAAN